MSASLVGSEMCIRDRLLDAPKAYTDYSENYFRIVPKGFNIDQVTHGTNADPNLITVEEVIRIINDLKS